jgi:DNA end-binding protein Ku
MAKQRAAKSPSSASKSRAARKPAAKPGSSKRWASRKNASTGLGVRPMWSGNLRLALVSVPVKLFPATKSGARISFHMVHEPSGKRVRHENVVPGIGPVDTDEIVKGFELEKGRYVLIDPKEIDALKLEAKKTLDLVQFVPACEIDPIWFDRPYYVVSDSDLAEEAYTVLRDALRSSGKVGLGQFVMRGREYIAALKPCGKGLMIETLRFADEVRSSAPFFAEVDEVKPDAELVKLAQELIARKSASFDARRFEDKYTEALREMIDAKAHNRKPVEIDDEEPTGGGKIIDLIEALKRSVKTNGEAKAVHKRKTG